MSNITLYQFKKGLTMNKSNMMRRLGTAVALILLVTVAVNAESGEKAEAGLYKHQTVCPVMGGKIDSTIYTDIQGQRVYHCCAGCSSKLKADPDIYFKKSATEGILFENIQTTCVVSGMKLKSKDYFVDFEGRRVYLCGPECKIKFEADPVKYLSESVTTQAVAGSCCATGKDKKTTPACGSN